MEKSIGIAGWRKSQRAEISAHTRVVFAATRGTLGRSANRSKAAPVARAARMQLYAPLLSPEPAWRIPYPHIITALNTLCRTITTNSLTPVTTPLATLVLGNVAATLCLIPKKPEHYPPSSMASFIAHSNVRPAILFTPFFLAPATRSDLPPVTSRWRNRPKPTPLAPRLRLLALVRGQFYETPRLALPLVITFLFLS